MSTGADGSQADGSSSDAAISGRPPRCVRAPRAEPGSRYGDEYPVCLRDLKKGTTTLVTPDTTGGTATADVLPGRIADGGHRILFQSSDPTLIPAADTNDGTDAFVRHLR
ncbi:MAG: hypothetical protein ACJ736_00695 [Streptomyces sp.]